MISKKEVENFLNERGYNLIGEYVNVITPMEIEKDGYKYVATFRHLKNGEQKSPKFGIKRNKFAKENLKLYIQRKNPNTKFIDAWNYKSDNKVRTAIKMKCQCGNEFIKELTHFQDKYGCICNKCARKKIADGQKQTDKYINLCKEKGYKILSEYIDNKTPIKVEELNTGYIGYITPTHIKNMTKMIAFSEYSNKDNYLYNINQYIKNNGIVCKALEITNEKDESKHSKIKFQCTCGDTFTTSFWHFCDGKYQCDKCRNSISTNEKIVKDFLEANNIEYIREYRINACRDEAELPFDFKIKKGNFLIEVQGEQHERPVTFGGMTKEQAEKQFHLQKRRDKIKKDFCNKHNIPLLEVWYYEIKNNTYKDKIINFINTIQA